MTPYVLHITYFYLIAGYPSTGSGGSSYPLTGPSSIHSSLDSAYPHNDFKAAIGYPNGYYKDASLYSKRAAPLYYVIENNASGKVSYW